MARLAAHAACGPLRSLLVEIHPPDLGADGLAAALEDLVAPAAGAASTPTVEVYGVEGASDEVVRLVWRVAQEAVRNALRHARRRAPRGRRSARSATGSCLDVTDDGVGFDRRSGTAAGGLGLRGLRDLVAEAGGRLDVRSAPGDGHHGARWRCPSGERRARSGWCSSTTTRWSAAGLAQLLAGGRRHRGGRPGRRRRRGRRGGPRDCAPTSC